MMRVSTANLLAAAQARFFGGDVLQGAEGYPPAHIANGFPELPWRSPTGQALHQMVFDLGATKSLDFVAIFGARAFTGTFRAALGPVTVWTTPQITDTGYVEAGSIAIDSAGDGALVVAARQARRVRLDFPVQDGLARTLEVGELWAGTAPKLPLEPRRVARRPLRATVRHEARGGSSWSTKRGEKRMRFDLEFPPMSGAQATAFGAILDVLEGGHRPAVLLLEEDYLAGVYHGRFDDDAGDEIEPDHVWRGGALGFTQSGRILGG